MRGICDAEIYHVTFVGEYCIIVCHKRMRNTSVERQSIATNAHTDILAPLIMIRMNRSCV